MEAAMNREIEYRLLRLERLATADKLGADAPDLISQIANDLCVPEGDQTAAERAAVSAMGSNLTRAWKEIDRLNDERKRWWEVAITPETRRATEIMRRIDMMEPLPRPESQRWVLGHNRLLEYLKAITGDPALDRLLIVQPLAEGDDPPNPPDPPQWTHGERRMHG